MPNILDNYKPKFSAFSPRTTEELLALRLATKLGEPASARHFANLAAKHSEDQLLVAFRRTAKSEAGNLARQFHDELDRLNGNALSGNRDAKLLALRIERRSIAAAVFNGQRLEYTQLKQLSSAKDRSFVSTVGFVNWLCEQFQPESAVVENVPHRNEIQRGLLTETAVDQLRENGVPMWEITKQEQFTAYGYPPLRSRRELREVIDTIWPILSGSKSKSLIQDAVALGLHIQIERLFL